MTHLYERCVESGHCIPEVFRHQVDVVIDGGLDRGVPQHLADLQDRNPGHYNQGNERG